MKLTLFFCCVRGNIKKRTYFHLGLMLEVLELQTNEQNLEIKVSILHVKVWHNSLKLIQPKYSYKYMEFPFCLCLLLFRFNVTFNHYNVWLILEEWFVLFLIIFIFHLCDKAHLLFDHKKSLVFLLLIQHFW